MFIVIITIISLVTLCILIHYDILFRLSEVLRHAHILPQLRIVIGLVGALFAHVIEIGVFSVGYYILGEHSELGSLVSSAGEPLNHISEYIYFSSTTYTSLGFGDIIPQGSLRFVASIEVLLGLVLIAWTASFIYVEMQRFWKV